jgi:hypothetical protein
MDSRTIYPCNTRPIAIPSGGSEHRRGFNLVGGVVGGAAHGGAERHIDVVIDGEVAISD